MNDYSDPYKIGNASGEEIPENLPDFERSDFILSVAVGLLAFGFVRFVLFNPTGFITTGLYIAIITAVIIFLKNKKFRISGFNRFIAVLLYLFSLVFSITDNGFIKLLDVIFLFGTGAYFIYSVTAQKTQLERFLPFAMMKALFEYPFSKFGTQSKVIKSTVKKSSFGKNLSLIFIGIIITIPITSIVASLLMSADENFSDMLNGFADKFASGNIGLLLAQILIAIPCSFYLFGMIYANVSRKNLNILDEEYCKTCIANSRFMNNIIIYTAITPLCILYIMFFISQAGYFLSGFGGKLPEGYSYSDYARQGFFELFAVSLINLFVIIVSSFIAKQGGKDKPLTLKIYNILLCIFTLILIATAISKMVLYINEYGLTQLRVYTTWFMILCSLIFILIIIKQINFDFKFSRWCVLFFTVMFGFLCFSRPDALIAKYNIEMYNSGKLEELDSYAIMKMSDDALLEYIKRNPEINQNINPREDYDKYNISSLLLNNYVYKNNLNK